MATYPEPDTRPIIFDTANFPTSFSDGTGTGTDSTARTEITAVETNLYNSQDFIVLPDGGSVSSQSFQSVKVYTSIQTAITDANSAGGGVIRLLEGTYTVSSQIQVYSNITILGSGYATEVYSTISTSTVQSSGSCTNALFYGQDVTGVNFRNFRMTNTSGTMTVNTGMIVLQGSCSYCSIEGIQAILNRRTDGTGSSYSGAYIIFGRSADNSTMSYCNVSNCILSGCRIVFQAILTQCSVTENQIIINTANANTYGIFDILCGNGTSATTSTIQYQRNVYSLLSGSSAPRGFQLTTVTSSSNRYSSVQFDFNENIINAGLNTWGYYQNYLLNANSNLDILNSKFSWCDNTIYNDSTFGIPLFRNTTDTNWGGYYNFVNNTVLPTTTSSSSTFRWTYNSELLPGSSAVTYYINVLNTPFDSYNALYYTTTTGVTNVPTFYSSNASGLITLSNPTNQLQFQGFEPTTTSGASSSVTTMNINASRATASSRVITIQDYCENGRLLISNSNGDMTNKADAYLNNNVTIGDFDYSGYTKTTNYESEYSFNNLSTGSYTFAGTEKQALVWATATSSYNVTLTGGSVFQVSAGYYQVDWKVKLGGASSGSINMIVSIESSSDGSTWSGTDIYQYYGGLKQWYSGDVLESSFLINATTNTYWRLMLATGLATTVSVATGAGGSYIFVKNTKEYGSQTSCANFTLSTGSVSAGSNRPFTYTSTANIADPTSVIPSPATPTTTNCWTLTAGTYMIDCQFTMTTTNAGGILFRYRVDSETGFGAPFYARDHTSNYETPANINPQTFHWRDFIQIDSTYKYLNIACYVGMSSTFSVTAPLSFINIYKLDSSVAGIYALSGTLSTAASTTNVITTWTAQSAISSFSAFGGNMSNGIFCFDKYGIYTIHAFIDGDTDTSGLTTTDPTMTLDIQYSSDNVTWTTYSSDTFKQVWYNVTASGGDVSSGMTTSFTFVVSNTARFWRFRFTNGIATTTAFSIGIPSSVYIKPNIYFGSVNIADASLHGNTYVKSGTLYATSGVSTTALTATNATNQLVLGTTNTATISATAPVSSLVYTIPDASVNADFVLTESSQTINGTKTFGSAINAPSGKLTATSNQLVLGTTNTTTLSATAPASSRTYTIPEAGTNCSFVMTEASSAQTIGNGIIVSNSSNQIGLKKSSHTVYLNNDGSSTNGVKYTLPLVTADTDFVVTGPNSKQSISNDLSVYSLECQSTPGLKLKNFITDTKYVRIGSAGQPASDRTYNLQDLYSNGFFPLSRAGFGRISIETISLYFDAATTSSTIRRFYPNKDSTPGTFLTNSSGGAISATETASTGAYSGTVLAFLAVYQMNSASAITTFANTSDKVAVASIGTFTAASPAYLTFTTTATDTAGYTFVFVGYN